MVSIEKNWSFLYLASFGVKQRLNHRLTLKYTQIEAISAKNPIRLPVSFGDKYFFANCPFQRILEINSENTIIP